MAWLPLGRAGVVPYRVGGKTRRRLSEGEAVAPASLASTGRAEPPDLVQTCASSDESSARHNGRGPVGYAWGAGAFCALLLLYCGTLCAFFASIDGAF